MTARSYNSETDYPTLLEIVKQSGEMSIAFIALALPNHGITWPGNFNMDTSPSTMALDRDMTRAWNECGYHRRPNK